MALQIPDSATLGAKYVKRASAASPEYKAGVANPRRPQAASAIAAKATWAAATQAAIDRDGFAKGLQKSGEAKWQNNSATLGGTRYGPGVTNAQGEWQAGVDPYLATLRSIDIGPKGLKGSPENYQRSQKVGDALHAQKLRQG